MKKIYLNLILSLMSVSVVIYSMEFNISEGKQEIEETGFDLLSPELLEKIALHATSVGAITYPHESAKIIKLAYDNVNNFLVALGKRGYYLFKDQKFIKYLVDTLYNNFIPPLKDNVIPWKDFASAITIATLFNNTYATEKLMQWLNDGRIDTQEQQKLFADYASSKIDDNSPLTNSKIIFLIENMGININDYYDGYTLLITAANFGNKAMVHYLIDNGAHIDDPNKYGATPLSSAIEKGHDAIAKYLIDKGANVNVHNNSGLTPLMWAVMTNAEELVHYLICNNADMDAVDILGGTARDLAQSRGQQNMVTVLDKAAKNQKSKCALM